MSKIRVGMVGAGNIAQEAHLPAYARRDDVELVAICDLNKERAKQAAAKYGIANVVDTADELALRNDIDYIDICCWNASHAPVAIAAAKGGKHVLCEKPMAINLDAAKQMYDAIKPLGVQFMMAMPNRFRPDIALIREKVDAGDLGDIYHAKTGIMRRRGTPKGWFTDLRKAGGGPVIDIAVHCLDRTWYMMGCPKPTRVSGQISHAIGNYETRGVNRYLALDSDVTAFDTEDSATAIIHFENGASMLLETSWAYNGPNADYSLIAGSKGGATLDPFTVYTEDHGYLVDCSPTVLPPDNFYREIDHFIDCVRTGKQPLAPIEHGLMVQSMLQGIYDSAKLGKEVVL